MVLQVECITLSSKCSLSRSTSIAAFACVVFLVLVLAGGERSELRIAKGENKAVINDFDPAKEYSVKVIAVSGNQQSRALQGNYAALLQLMHQLLLFSTCGNAGVTAVENLEFDGEVTQPQRLKDPTPPEVETETSEGYICVSVYMCKSVCHYRQKAARKCCGCYFENSIPDSERSVDHCRPTNDKAGDPLECPTGVQKPIQTLTGQKAGNTPDTQAPSPSQGRVLDLVRKPVAWDVRGWTSSQRGLSSQWTDIDSLPGGVSDTLLTDYRMAYVPTSTPVHTRHVYSFLSVG
ncbi:hypothetical protein NFI96_005121 [Prochilodus magdalenae]|nr:hypothetical protein NFI96_005121 [Prochilodus magdalenae]